MVHDHDGGGAEDVEHEAGHVGEEAIPDEGWADLADAPFGVDDEICGQCDEDDEVVVQDDVGECHHQPRELPGPKAPSKDAVRKHNLTH